VRQRRAERDRHEKEGKHLDSDVHCEQRSQTAAHIQFISAPAVPTVQRNKKF